MPCPLYLPRPLRRTIISVHSLTDPPLSYFSRLSGQEEQIGGFDLIFKNAPVRLPPNSTYSTLLGCYNNRNQQLKKLAKSTAIRLAQQFQE